jgi:hypothetical protein
MTQADHVFPRMNKSDSKEPVRGVCRLLYEIDSDAKDEKMLRQDASLDTLQTRFFLGNDLLKKPR